MSDDGYDDQFDQFDDEGANEAGADDQAGAEGAEGTVETKKRTNRPPSLELVKVDNIPAKAQRGGTPRYERFRGLLEMVQEDPEQPYRIALYNSTRGAQETKRSLDAALEVGQLAFDGGSFELTSVVGAGGAGTSGLFAVWHEG